jgi:Zn-dependent oligopeptidase
MEAQDKKNAINALVDRKLKEVEQLAEAGRVNESEALIKEIEQLKEQREDQEAMVCEICGAMQSATDTERRQVSHLEGKQHIGFATIRKCIEEIKSHRDIYRHIDLSKPPKPLEDKVEEPRRKHSRSPRRN